MKVWFLEQKLRQLELDVHRNNTELLMMKSQPPQGRLSTNASILQPKETKKRIYEQRKSVSEDAKHNT